MKDDVVIYTKDHGKLRLTYDEWRDFNFDAILPHRVRGPAVTYANGEKQYWVNGVLHSLKGPAESFKNFKEYWIGGNNVSREKFKQVKKEIEAMTLAERLTDHRWWVREYNRRDKNG